jgi:hypothetical protein
MQAGGCGVFGLVTARLYTKQVDSSQLTHASLSVTSVFRVSSGDADCEPHMCSRN